MKNNFGLAVLHNVFFYIYNFFNVYLFLRERESRGGAERKGAVSTELDMGLELTDREIMT